MAEPDHIFVRPLPNLAYGGHPAAFPFFYIRPDENEKIIRKFYPEELGPVTNVDPIGNSPVIIRKVEFLPHQFLMAELNNFPCPYSCHDYCRFHHHCVERSYCLSISYR